MVFQFFVAWQKSNNDIRFRKPTQQGGGQAWAENQSHDRSFSIFIRAWLAVAEEAYWYILYKQYRYKTKKCLLHCLTIFQPNPPLAGRHTANKIYKCKNTHHQIYTNAYIQIYVPKNISQSHTWFFTRFFSGQLQHLPLLVRIDFHLRSSFSSHHWWLAFCSQSSSWT